MSFLDNAAAAFALVAQWESLLALTIGVIVGVTAGAIPGMSATMAVALALPFTFALPPIHGILLPLMIYGFFSHVAGVPIPQGKIVRLP
jgi:putative tricarboxylic transport membrane protein